MAGGSVTPTRKGEWCAPNPEPQFTTEAQRARKSEWIYVWGQVDGGGEVVSQRRSLQRGRMEDWKDGRLGIAKRTLHLTRLRGTATLQVNSGDSKPCSKLYRPFFHPSILPFLYLCGESPFSVLGSEFRVWRAPFAVAGRGHIALAIQPNPNLNPFGPLCPLRLCGESPFF
jgi:hypothetical protein